MPRKAAPMRARDVQARPRPRARVRAREARPFIALDGESVTDAAGHRYVLLMASTGEKIVDPAGIPTHRALDFHLKLANTVKGIFVGFAYSYDVNMILRDIPREALEHLWREGWTDYAGPNRTYYIEWIPNKLFAVSTGDPMPTTCKVFDVFGFYQSSFVKALKAWGIGADEFLESMKDHRADFTFDQIEEIERYCLHECELLVQLMEALRDALDAVGLSLRSWLGAGSIASALMSRHAVQKHLTPLDRDPPAVREMILRAYFGGRTELFQQGEFDKVIARDLNSAYPAETINLPSMVGKWKRSREYDPDALWALWRVRWNCDDGTTLAPFPFRYKRAITYPLAGEGVYHACEVAAALKFHPDIEVLGGYIFTPDDPSERPFAFLREVYEERRQLKADGHAGEKVLKLGINSVYGKLAQGAGRNGAIPKFQSYYWAGRVTAGCRAKAFELCARDPLAVVSIATDGVVFSGVDPSEPDSSELGEWERSVYDDFFVAQPGMYTAMKNGSPMYHSRGFFTKEIDWPALREAWKSDGVYGEISGPSTRFIGLGAALMRSDFSIWRTWHSGTRKVNLLSSRKFYDPKDFGEIQRRLYPPEATSPELSAPYVPKRALVELDEDNANYVEGIEQPLVS